MLPLLFDALHMQRDGEGGAGGAVPPPTPPAPVAPPPPPAAPAAPPAGGQNPEERIKQLEKDLASARSEAAGYRTGNKGQLAEAARALAGLAGIELPGNQAPDVQTIVKQLQDRDQQRDKELRGLKVDNALGEIYAKHGVKPKLTRALLESDGVLSTLDPSDAEFSKTLNAAVKKLADETPELKVSAAPAPPPRSGPDLPPGGNGTPPQLSKADLERMSSKEISDAFAKGQLNGVLGRH